MDRWETLWMSVFRGLMSWSEVRASWCFLKSSQTRWLVERFVLSLGSVTVSTVGQWSYRNRINRKFRWTRFLLPPTRNFLSVLSAARCEQSCGPTWLSCLRVQEDVGGVPSPTARFAD